MPSASKDATKLRMEISFIGPESALSAPSKPANFLLVLGSAKVVFHGPAAKRL